MDIPLPGGRAWRGVPSERAQQPHRQHDLADRAAGLPSFMPLILRRPFMKTGLGMCADRINRYNEL
jgi:hypothetical protein